jgi:hypothetical protein
MIKVKVKSLSLKEAETTGITDNQVKSAEILKKDFSGLIGELFVYANVNEEGLKKMLRLGKGIIIHLSEINRILTDENLLNKEVPSLAAAFKPDSRIKVPSLSVNKFVNPEKFNEPRTSDSRLQGDFANIQPPKPPKPTYDELDVTKPAIKKLQEGVPVSMTKATFPEFVKKVEVANEFCNNIINSMNNSLEKEYMQRILGRLKRVEEITEMPLHLESYIKNLVKDSLNEILLFESELGHDTADLEDGTPVCEACLYEAMTCGCPDTLEEAKYQGRSVPLGKPMRGDVKKFKVYVRDPSTGNIKKVNFGDPNMKIKKSNPKRRKSFRARHNCDNPGPRTKARYWSCRKW